MATRAVKVKNDESQPNAITGAASGAVGKVTDFVQNSRDFLHETRVEMKQVTWPSRDDVISTTWVVIATVFFFALFLWVVDNGVHRAVTYIMKIFGAA